MRVLTPPTSDVSCFLEVAKRLCGRHICPELPVGQAALTLGLDDISPPLGVGYHHFCFMEEETEAPRERAACLR